VGGNKTAKVSENSRRKWDPNDEGPFFPETL
jgi:hypothetical protein